MCLSELLLGVVASCSGSLSAYVHVPEQVVARSCCSTLRFFECMYVYVCTLYVPEQGVIAPCSGISIHTCISVVVHVLSLDSRPSPSLRAISVLRPLTLGIERREKAWTISSRDACRG